MFNLLKFLDEYILKFLKACLCECFWKARWEGHSSILAGLLRNESYAWVALSTCLAGEQLSYVIVVLGPSASKLTPYFLENS